MIDVDNIDRTVRRFQPELDAQITDNLTHDVSPDCVDRRLQSDLKA
jgi:hypothetical protein